MGKFSSLLQQSNQQGNRFFFVFTEGKYKGGEFTVTRDAQIIIGRDISCDVAIIDAKVSRKHARIWNNNGTTYIEDSNSTNGSSLNGKQLKAGEPYKLTPGDELVIGDSTFAFTGTKGSDVPDGEKPVPPEEPKLLTPDPLSTASPAAKPSAAVTGRPTIAPAAKPEMPGLDAALDNLTNEDDHGTPPHGVSVAKVSLEKRDVKAALAKTRFDGTLHAKEGKLSKIEPIELLKILMQSSSVGILQVKVTEPFMEKIDIRLGEKGATGANSLTNKLFAEEKAFTRFLLAKDGDYQLKESEEPRKEKMNQALFDIFMEISSQKPLLTRYRKIASANNLRFLIPITGKLSSLGKKELDTIQFMVNALEVTAYLNMFPDQDEFLLLAEILKYIDMGILFGDNNEETGLPSAGDIMDL
ncbi:MAG TPA: FHA domain-containing protein [bacterium]|nr:FHA domain-containing protein [bacterium]